MQIVAVLEKAVKFFFDDLSRHAVIRYYQLLEDFERSCSVSPVIAVMVGGCCEGRQEMRWLRK
jgi:hypothetical protein